jgi:hypothetical protein
MREGTHRYARKCLRSSRELAELGALGPTYPFPPFRPFLCGRVALWVAWRESRPTCEHPQRRVVPQPEQLVEGVVGQSRLWPGNPSLGRGGRSSCIVSI